MTAVNLSLSGSYDARLGSPPPPPRYSGALPALGDMVFLKKLDWILYANCLRLCPRTGISQVSFAKWDLWRPFVQNRRTSLSIIHDNEHLAFYQETRVQLDVGTLCNLWELFVTFEDQTKHKTSL